MELASISRVQIAVTKIKAGTSCPLELIDTKVPAFIYFSSVGSPVFQNFFFKISPFALAGRDGCFLATADWEAPFFVWTAVPVQSRMRGEDRGRIVCW